MSSGSSYTNSRDFPPGYGDFKLISSDKVAFHIPRSLLTHVSPVFRDMFAMGDGPSELQVTEDASTLRLLLLFFDPVQDIDVPMDFGTLTALLEAAQKYQAPQVVKWWEREVRKPSRKKLNDPMLCLAIAARFSLHETVRAALRDLVKAPLKELQTPILFESKLFSHLLELRADRSAWFRAKLTQVMAPVWAMGSWRFAGPNFQRVATWFMEVAAGLDEEPSWRILMAYWDKVEIEPLRRYVEQGAFEQWRSEAAELEDSLPELPK
ncbi:hypothetical protein PIIN_02351 [Serendipita indica DSM 11827]|uniref:BTB domain-containing protein n=1 Tax=Serendipita indica (strain DSM 11827) TaxID=1109443 RepID=G4TAZ4_SERID|nr:hypothetical protein PIIN_02351 [Serendipita indica DSM 11827]